METLEKLRKIEPLNSRLHWLPRFMDWVMKTACVLGGCAVGYIIVAGVWG